MTRHGKIARLPRAVREELNKRLDNGESGVKLAKWLNGLKEVKKVLRENFGGRAITADNLSEWKRGGFVEWQARQEALEQAREMSAQAMDLNEATARRLTDNLATVLAARYAKVLSGWDGKVTEEFSTQLRALRSMCLDVAELRRGDHNRERVELERDRWEKNREQPERRVLTPEELEARYERIFGITREVRREDPPSPSLRRTGEAAEGGETMGVDRSKSDPPSPSLRRTVLPSADETADGRASETGETPVPLANSMVAEAAAPLAAGSEKGVSQSQERADEASALLSPRASNAVETIGVDPSKSHQEEERASSSAKSAMEDRPADRKATGGQRPNPAPKGAIKGNPHQMVDGIMLGMSAKMLLKPREERYALLPGGGRVYADGRFEPGK
jgi:hypothetical protein